MLTDLIPVLLGLLVLGLFVLTLAGAVIPGQARWIMAASAALCGTGLLAALGFLLAAAPATGFAVPIGLPGTGAQLGVDALSGFFLVALFIAGAACSVYSIDRCEPADQRAMVFLPAFIGAMALTLLAADGFSLVSGFALTALVCWATVLARHEEAASRHAALHQFGMAAFGVACLIAALTLLAASGTDGPDLRFAAMRAAAPEGWRAAAVFVLVLLGAGSQAGLAPLHGWLPPAHAAAPGPAAALMTGAMTKVALYVAVRLLFDLCGPAQPLWWGVPLIVFGVASAVLGGLRATMEADLRAVLAASTVGQAGFIAIGLGVALAARAADLPSLASLALGAALLHTLNHGVFGTLLVLCAEAAQRGAGSRVLARLGGLIHQMPVTTCCALAGCAGLAALPPGPGFAGLWILFQAVLAATRIGGTGWQMLLAVAAALMAMAVALAATAAVRLIGVAFLGRPRTPRTAAAEEAGPAARWAMLGLAGLAGLFGLLPGPVFRLAEPAVRGLTGSGLAGRAGWLVIAPTAETRGYAPLAVALLLAAAGAALVWTLRRWTVAGIRRAPAWGGGFAAAPPWLPFGDPMTQYSAASFAQPLHRSLGAARRDATRRTLLAPLRRLRAAAFRRAGRPISIRQALAAMFAALVLFLAAVALLEV